MCRKDMLAIGHIYGKEFIEAVRGYLQVGDGG
jgi:hypothetical protein